MTFYIAFSLANSCYLEFAEDFGESFINWKHLEVTFHQTDLFKDDITQKVCTLTVKFLGCFGK